eukprot:4301575-Pyramimonas_sp.AAC.1
MLYCTVLYCNVLYWTGRNYIGSGRGGCESYLGGDVAGGEAGVAGDHDVHLRRSQEGVRRGSGGGLE